MITLEKKRAILQKLEQNESYVQIQDELKVSPNTIAKVRAESLRNSTQIVKSMYMVEEMRNKILDQQDRIYALERALEQQRGLLSAHKKIVAGRERMIIDWCCQSFGTQEEAEMMLRRIADFLLE